MRRDEKFGVPLVLIALAFCVWSFATNAGTYMEVTRFEILDAPQGFPVQVSYERKLKRDFQASWTVDLYRDNVYIATARSTAPHTYRTTAVLPAGIDLAWLTLDNPAFADFACGRYTIAAQWTINPDSHIMRRTIEARDDFEVTCP